MENKYSLTFPQKNIWLVENFYDNKKINIISGSLYINSDFNVHLAEKTINKFVQLNDAMRLQINIEEGMPNQKVMPYKKFIVEKIDVSKKTEEDIKKIKEDYISKPIEIINSELFSYLLLDRGNEKGEIFLKAHHLICDAWSVSKMGEGLSSIYQEFLNGIEREEEYPSYLNYIEKEREYLASDKSNKDKDFWQEYLSGFSEAVGIKNIPEGTTYEAKRYKYNLTEDVEKKVFGFCKETKCSPFTVFMVAIAIYIYRTTEKNDIVIGTPILNRSNFAEKNMQGMFVSTMPIRFKINEEETFIELCKKNALETMTLFRHQRYPYSKISEEHKENNGMKEKLYKMMVSYQNARTEFGDKEKYEITWDFSGAIQDAIEVHIADLNNDGKLNIFFDYLTDVFDEVEIKHLAKRIEEIIKDGIDNNKTIETINIMPRDEEEKILNQFNNTKTNYPNNKTIIELFEEQVNIKPNDIALIFNKKEMTYSELNNKANQVATYLKTQNIKQDDCVAVTLDKSFELLIAILAILKIGAAYVPIDKLYNKERKKFILKDSMCKLNIVDNNEEPSIISKLNIKDFEYIKDYVENPIREKINADDNLAYVMYTSGTTGKPKGVMVTNRNVVRLVKNTNYIEFKEDDRIIQTGATVFDACTFEYWGALLNGLTLCLISKNEMLDPKKFKQFIKDNKITIMWLTSQLFNQFVDIDIEIFSSLRVLLTGGDVLSVKHINMVKEKYPNLIIVNGYGPTENTTFSNCFIIDKKYDKRIPIGPPVSNSTGYVLDSKNRLLPLFVEGEWVVGGDGVAKGYINNTELTKEKFIPDMFKSCGTLYKTGDIAKWLDKGIVDFIGRRDNQVKINGFRIELDEIKIAIQSLSNDIKDVVVTVKNKENKKKIYSYITSKNKENVDFMKARLKAILPSYMVPTGILQVENIPLTTNGKVDFKQLPQIKSNEISNQEFIEYNGIYKKIYELFSEILQEDNVGPYDNFFDIGGDSLSAVKLVTKAMGRDLLITYSDLYKYGTIKALGDMLETRIQKESMSADINNIDYTDINKLIRKNNISINQKVEIDFEPKDILITGATGFLGAHILEQCLNNYKGNIYCLMRGSNIKFETNRLRQKMKFFFGDKYNTYFDNRIKVVLGDITTEKIFSNDIDLKDVNIIINCAAYVKHFGSIEQFEAINSKGVENLCKCCVNNNIRLIHISTLSVSGNILETGQVQQDNIKPNTIYNETNFYIGQDLDNVYAYTKFLGEKVVYDYIINKNLDAKIMRMGNLTGRYTDGKFQPNVEENAFSNRIKTIIELGVMPQNILEFYLEFTPIDKAAEAVRLLSTINADFNTFHIFNHKHAQMTFVDEVFKEIGINLQHITKKEMTILLEKYMNTEGGYEKIKGLILDINKNKELDYKPNTIVKSDFTIEVLKSLGFEWNDVTSEYIKNYINYLYKINFLKGDN